ncbi:hypothetical protein G4B88_011967 [Cannabis sativa]|uniref:Transposase-associated domain-containing protein n=1 Tax=Cannabis sativa TaxID=3483 RepID=A0A7J6HCI6_CANSA|nr:hypothetical protein G4B88_011967 [Cannabis sativa]
MQIISSLEEERLGFFVLQLSAPKDNRWCFVLNSSDDMNFECLGLLRMCEIISVFTVKTGKSSLEQISKVYGNQAVVVSIDPRRVYINDPNDVEFKTVQMVKNLHGISVHLIILCSWKSIGGAIDSFTETFGRASNEYKEGARSFVETIEKEANYPEKLLCPCKFCRNLSHQKVNLLYEHLVINGIDPTYTIWFHHGEEAPRSDDIEEMNSFDAFNLFSATNIDRTSYVKMTMKLKNVKKNKESKIQETQKDELLKAKNSVLLQRKTRRKMIVRDSSEDEETPGQEKEICSTKRKRSLRKKASRSKTPIPISLTPISNSPTVNTRSKTPQISITMPTIDSPALNTRGSLRRRSIGSSPVLDDDILGDSSLPSKTPKEKGDLLSNILGPEKGSYVRGYGKGVTKTKLAIASEKEEHICRIENEYKELKEKVAVMEQLINSFINSKSHSNLSGEQSNAHNRPTRGDVGIQGQKCDLLDWTGSGNINLNWSLMLMRCKQAVWKGFYIVKIMNDGIPQQWCNLTSRRLMWCLLGRT